MEGCLPLPVTELLSRVLDPLYFPGSSLAPSASARELQRLSALLFEPLQPHLESKSVLLVLHKDLQALPFGMLRDGGGDFLLESYHFSYLPSISRVETFAEPLSGPPLLMLPSDFRLSERRTEKLFFTTHFPQIRVINDLRSSPKTGAHWIHLSAHFQLHDDTWIGSALADGRRAISVLQFLKHPISCTLLSLGVCDAGNGYSSGSLYWLGFSEPLLTGGVGALLLSRWRMDELSSKIYRDFYAHCQRGLPMDEALSQSKRAFMARSFRREGVQISGDHPFLWAGIPYVGKPGTRLYSGTPSESPLPWFYASALCLVAVLWASHRLAKGSSARLDR